MDRLYGRRYEVQLPNADTISIDTKIPKDATLCNLSNIGIVKLEDDIIVPIPLITLKQENNIDILFRRKDTYILEITTHKDYSKYKAQLFIDYIRWEV